MMLHNDTFFVVAMRFGGRDFSTNVQNTEVLKDTYIMFYLNSHNLSYKEVIERAEKNEQKCRRSQEIKYIRKQLIEISLVKMVQNQQCLQ